MINRTITSFRYLDVYQNSYQGCVSIHQKILPKRPQTEKFNLYDQLNRSSKAVPRLIAEGYAKRHQRAGFQKYIDDAMGEANETVVGLEQIKDLYCIETELCKQLIDLYDKIGRQLYNLGRSWTNFKSTESSSPKAVTA